MEYIYIYSPKQNAFSTCRGISKYIGDINRGLPVHRKETIETF